MLNVREPHTGMTASYDNWGDWRGRWARRPLSLTQRVRMCPWCWGFGGLLLWGERTVVPVPCLGCGRECRELAPVHRVSAACPTCGRR